MTRRRLTIAAMLFAAVAACSRPAETRASLEPPADAVRIGNVPTVVLTRGHGAVHPDLTAHSLVTLSWVRYNADGTQHAGPPAVLQDVRGLERPWQQVVLRMVAGEVRRAWFPTENGVRVYDLRLQAVGGAR